MKKNKVKVTIRNYSIITKKLDSEVSRYFNTQKAAEEYVSLWADFPGVEVFIASESNT